MSQILDFDTIIYHTQCNDGTASLWSAIYYKEIREKIPCKAGVLPNLTPHEKNILFVDICPKFEYLLTISKTANNIVVLDHHQTTIDDYEKNKFECPDNLKIILDKERAGCQITWDYFHRCDRPWFINYTADRDLWAWKLPNSKEITLTIYENNMLDPYNLDKITKLLNFTEEDLMLAKIKNKQIEQAVNKAVEATMVVNEKKYNIWIGNITYGDRSDLGNQLATKPLNNGTQPDFSATWIYEPKSREWWISLRGHKLSPDLSQIASFYEGGGHKLASGLVIKYPKTLHDIFLIK